jgi:hypothetical protein
MAAPFPEIIIGVRFAAIIVVAVLAAVGSGAIFAGDGFLSGAPASKIFFLNPFIAAVIVFFFAGMWAGAGFGRGKQTALAFGLSFVVALPLLVGLIASILDMRTRNVTSDWTMVFGLVGMGALIFGLMGLLGAVATGERWRTVIAGSIAFAVSGAFGGVLITAAMVLKIDWAALPSVFVAPAIGATVLARLMNR